MIDVDKWQEIFTSIGKHPTRTVLTAFGVAWGIFMLVLLLGAGQGLQNGIDYQFEGDAMNSIWINPGRTSVPHNGMKEGRRIVMDNDDYDYILDQFKEVEQMSGKYFLRGNKVAVYGDKALSFSVQGVHVDGQVVESLEITKGRFINKVDLDQTRKVAVIGGYVQRDLFDGKDPVGEEIVLDGTNFQVIGVFHDPEGENTMRRIYLPISTVQKVYTANDRLDQLILVAGDLSIDEMNALEDEVTRGLKDRHLVAYDDRRAFRIWNMAEEYQSVIGLMTAIKGITWMVGIFSMIAGVIGVSNIMLIIVKDRTKEIGIRKAIGATPRSIIAMIFQESIFITGIAGYLGLFLGILVLWGLQGMESEFFRNPQVNFWLALTATIVLILAGALAGLLPAMQAAKINPVTAIKSE